MAIAVANDPKPRTIGRYSIFGQIAAGGMATIHYGRLHGPAGFSRTVAIKRLHPHLAQDPEFLAMFLDEARLAARIRHPNVLPTLDVVAEEGELFLVLEYVLGESLSRLRHAMIAKGVGVDARVAASVMGGILRGLHAAHEARGDDGRPLSIVHRDVSPQNVMVGVDGVPRVLDFGVAKAVGRSQTTRNGKVKGKLAYMSPEQLTGGRIDRRCDVYAAAVVMWELLTGQRLFSGPNEGAVIAAVLKGGAQPPSRIAAHAPPAFDPIVLRGLAQDPAQRFATAQDMAVAVEEAVGVVSPSAVGAWVQWLAAATLEERLAQVAEIEQCSGTGRSAGPPRATTRADEALTAAEHLTPARVDGTGDDAEISRVAVTRPIHGRPTTRHRGTVLGLVLAGAVVASAALLGRSVAVPAAGAPPSIVATVVPPPAPPASIDVAVPPATAPPAATPPPPQEEDQAPPSIPTKETSAPRRLPPARALEKKQRAGSTACDPPFTLDERGHKHYKESCL